MARTLITGGAGFVGSHLVDAALARGDEVLVVDDLSNGKRTNLIEPLESGRAHLAVLDIADADALAAAAGGFAPQHVFHIAGQADARKAIADPADDARSNLFGTINVLELARRAGATVVFTATGGAAYGEGENRWLPFRETDETRPETAYGVSKLGAEKYVAFYRLLHRVPALSLRLGNVYGPRQDPHGEAGVVAIFCGRLLAGERPVIFGDGEQTRDYVFVGDVVRALLAAEAALEAGRARGDVYNIGTGIETSVMQLATALGAIAGRSVTVQRQPRRTGEIQRVAIAPDAAGRDLGWEPETALADGLLRTFEWARGRVGAMAGA